MQPIQIATEQNKFALIREQLRELVSREAPGTRMSERDLAVQFGVNRQTVRRAIDDLVSDGLLRRQARSGVFVEAPSQHTMRTYCLLYSHGPRLSQYIDNFQHSLFCSFERVITARGDRLLLTSKGANIALPTIAAETDGVILCCWLRGDMLSSHTGMPIPTVVPLRPDIVKEHLGHVIVDDHFGGMTAAQHLISLGHERLAFVGYLDYCEQERFRGVCHTLTAAGLHAPLLIDQGEGIVTPALLDPLVDGNITGVICANDAIALTVISSLHKRGKHVPEDISVVGFDNSRLAATFAPTLTTVGIDVDLLANTVVDELAARIRYPERNVLSRTVLPMELVIRESTAPPPSR